MILLAGGTGTLGTMVVGQLRQRGLEVRVLTRDKARARHRGDGSQIVTAEVSDPVALARAAHGAKTVVSAIHGFTGPRGVSPASVDRDGNRGLIRAALDAGAEHLVLVSVRDAGPDHPMSLMRMKFAAEQDLRASGLAWTIIRPSAFMETWCEVLGRPLLAKGKTMLFGRGRNPINWVSAADVAGLVDLAVADPALRGRVIDVGGPENLTMGEFAEVFRYETGCTGRVGRVPLPVMRASLLAMRLASPALARQVQAGIVMDTTSQAFDAAAARRDYPSLPFTTLAEVVRRDFARSGPDKNRTGTVAR